MSSIFLNEALQPVLRRLRQLFNITLVLFLLVSSSALHARVRHIKHSDIEASHQQLPDPDNLLAEVFRHLAENNLRAAEHSVDTLIAAYPNFQLAHLIRGDLYLLHTTPVKALGGTSTNQANKLKELRDEALLRIKAFRDKPAADSFPRQVLRLRDDQKYVFLVDAKKSRLYVYANQGGQLRYFADHYISQGKFGVNKLKEGDQKTPVGVYYITSRLAGQKLPDFYGPGALPLNYPNEWDKLNGRTGSGIWLHGMPSETFSRPPLASDGCVVLTNPDFLKVAANVDIGKTPVIISESIEFASRTKWVAERQIADKLLEDWRLDLESKNINRILANYSRNFKNLQGDNLNAWLPKQTFNFDNDQFPTIKLRDITQFRYPGKDDIIVTTFTQDTSLGKNRQSVRKRQYWLREAARWRIVYEANV